MNDHAVELTTPTTLTGGTYNVYSGTIQLPGNVNTNAATILLDDACLVPSLLNGSYFNALANFATNAAAGNFTIQNGVSVTTASSDFDNAGTINLLPGTLMSRAITPRKARAPSASGWKV